MGFERGSAEAGDGRVVEQVAGLYAVRPGVLDGVEDRCLKRRQASAEANVGEHLTTGKTFFFHNGKNSIDFAEKQAPIRRVNLEGKLQR